MNTPRSGIFNGFAIGAALLAPIAFGALFGALASRIGHFPYDEAAGKSVMAAFNAWYLAVVTLLLFIPNAFGSKETLARNAKDIGTQNLVAARIVSVIGVLVGCMLVLVAVFVTYQNANEIFSAGGLLHAAIFIAGGLLTYLVIAFFSYRIARAYVARIAKANEDGSPKS